MACMPPLSVKPEEVTPACLLSAWTHYYARLPCLPAQRIQQRRQGGFSFTAASVAGLPHAHVQTRNRNLRLPGD